MPLHYDTARALWSLVLLIKGHIPMGWPSTQRVFRDRSSQSKSSWSNRFSLSAILNSLSEGCREIAEGR